MSTLALFALRIGVAAAVLAGCGGPQPIGTRDAMPQSSAVTAHPDRAGSASEHRAFPAKLGTSGENLLYVADGMSKVKVFSFPQGKLVGALNGISKALGLCSDASGNVYVTEDTNEVLEYAHAGTSPIKTLSARGATSCSWDPSTGNLAVVEYPYSIGIYSTSGAIKTYTDYNFLRFNYCAYDDKGDLFITGEAIGANTYALAEFNGETFTTINLSAKVYVDDLQWDGKYLAIDDFYQTGEINRVRVSGSSGIIEHTTTLTGTFYGYWTWLQGGKFISPIYTRRDHDSVLELWSYPSGGKPTKKLPSKDLKRDGDIRGITVSVGSSATVARHQSYK